MAEAKKEKKEQVQLVWRRVALVLLAVMLFCLAFTLYGMAPEGTFLWNPIANVAPFGPDTVRVKKTKEVFDGFVYEFEEMAKKAPEEGEEPEKVRKVTIALESGEKKTFLESELSDVKVNHVPIRPALIIAGVLFFIAYFALARKLWDKLIWHKPGQGLWVRYCGFITVFALSVFGAYTLYYVPGSRSWWRIEIFSRELLGLKLAFNHMIFPCVGCALLAMLITYLLFNRPKWADFQIETEGELKKVSWPSRKEYVGSSVVVLVVSVVIAVFLYVADELLSKLLPIIGGF